MKLHKRILSAVAAFLVLTSAVDLTQIAQLSVVAAAETVDDETTGDTTPDTEPVTPETTGTEGEDDKTDTNEEDENGEGGEDGENKGDGEGDDENDPTKNPEDGDATEPTNPGGNEGNEGNEGGENEPTTPVDPPEKPKEYPIGSLIYIISDEVQKTATVIGPAGDFQGGELVIPSKIGIGSSEEEISLIAVEDYSTYTVTAIANDAFESCFNLTSVTIPNTVTVIGDSAFDLCLGLTNVVIPDSVTTIGRFAFYGCSFEKVEIPGSVISLGESAFGECKKLETVKFNGTRKQWKALTDGNDIGFPEDFTVDCSDDTPGEITWNDKQNIPATTITRNTVITLDGDINLSGTLHIESGNVTIRGKGYTITRHEEFLSTMIRVDEGASLTIDNITIDGNDVKANSAAIYNKGALYINDSVVKNNRNTAARTRADDNEAINALFVGGIANDGTLELTNSAVYGNTADGNQSNIVAEWNDDNKAVTIINSGIIVGEIDGVTLKNGVNRGTIETNAGGYFIVKNGTNEAVCTNGDILYANPAGLTAYVGDRDISIDYDNLKWTFFKPAEKITWEANKVVDGIKITADTEITLNGNVALTGTIDIQSGNVTINGNDHTITRSKNFQYTMFLVAEGASLTINDVTFDGNKNFDAYSSIILNDGTLTANNCVFKNNNNTSAKVYSNALYVGGVANSGTLVLNNCAAFNNKAGGDAQSNVKSDTNSVTIYGGLIVGDIDSDFTTAESGTSRVSKGTIETNAKGTFTVTNGSKSVECIDGDVLYANSTGLTAKTGKETKSITYENSKWKFTVADAPDTVEWEAGTTVNGLKITKDTEIKIVASDRYPTATGITLDGTIDIESGNVTILGNSFTITRGENLKNDMVIVRNGATLTVDRVVFDGNKDRVQASPFSGVIINAGTLKIDRSVIKNNDNKSKLGGWGGFTYHSLSSGILNAGTLELTNSTIRGNDALYGSGALTNVGDANIVSCDIYDNTSTLVGGVENHGKLTISNSTIRDNKVIADNNVVIKNGLGVGGITGCNDDSNEITLPYAKSETVINNCSIYGNTKLGKQSNVQVTTNNRMSINGGLIVGEIAGNGTVTLDKNMRKGAVNARATDYFEVTNGTNTVNLKVNDVLYANPTGLRATIGNKTFAAVFENSKWIFSDECIITYQLNGGTITGTFENPKSYQYGAKVQFPTLTRNGYTFGGWYEDSLFAFPVKDTANVTATSNRTYYAKWTQNPGTQQPGTNQPGTSNPGTNQPGTSNPGASNPGTSQPGISDLINKGVIIGTNAPQGVIVSTLSDLIRYVLTNSDIEALQNKKKIDISLGITNINGSAPQSDRAVIEEFIRTLNDYRLGYLLDLKLYKTVGSDLYTVKETSGEITICINVPETLKASGRTFGIVRVHNGAATFLQDIDNNASTITFKTDKFSTYAIVYKDRQSGSSDNTSNPETGNRTHPAIAIAPVASSLTLVVTAKRKKKEEE